MRRELLWVCGMLLVGSVSAQQFNRCTDAKGVVTYSDKTCGDNGTKVQIGPSTEEIVASVMARQRAEMRGPPLTYELRQGMNEDEIMAAWSYPQHRNKTVTAGGAHEQWVYPMGGREVVYLYLEDGRLTSWTKSE